MDSRNTFEELEEIGRKDTMRYCAEHGLYHVDTMREDENGDYELRGAAEIATMYTALKKAMARTDA